MNLSKQILYAIAGLSILSMPLSAHETIRQLHAPRLNNSDATDDIIRRTPPNASYSTTLVGFITYAESWNDLDGITPLGIYTIATEPGEQPEPFARIGKANSLCNGGAILAGDTYWYIWRQTDPTGEVDMSQLYSYNILSGEFNGYGIVDSSLASNADKTWDPVENLIYGQYTVDNTRKLCIIDYIEQTITPVGDCYTYYGLAFDSTGQLWGIDAAGDLYKVDKRNGSATKIGSTGVTPKYSQSMTFDLKTDELYWASYTDAGKASSNLYRVDTTDGHITLVTTFTDRQEILGLGIMPALAADNAPGYITGLNVAMDGASTSGTISFTLPRYTYMGADLDGQISYRILANGNTKIEGTGIAGQDISHDITLPAGDVTVSVICTNSEGDGPEAAINQWVGEDYPMEPRNIRLSVNESTGKFSLTWDAVTEGAHGGYIDPAAITYTVTRYPDNLVVARNICATSFEETLAQPDLPTDYYYCVTALNDWRESPVAAESNHTPYGKGFEIPYFNSFDNEESLNLFYKIDGNNDDSTWKWSHYEPKTAYIFTGTDKDGIQNDWLITPGIDMKAGNKYQVSYTIVKNMNDGRFYDMLETAFGTGVEPESYTIAEQPFICPIGGTEKRSVIIEPQTDGYYHFGFHAISDCIKGLSIGIDDLNIDVIANDKAPSAVTGLTVKSSQGTAPISIRFTTPVTDTKGNKIESITKVDVFRNTSELVKSIEMTETGKLVTVVDNKGARGMTKYTVVAYNEYGIGERADIEIFLGMDFPGAPQDIMLTDEGNGNLKLSWKAPKTGANGGYCDTNNLTYNVYALSNGYYYDYKKGLRDTEIVISTNDYFSSKQELKLYAVTAVNSAGEGNAYQSSEVIVGTPYNYPFIESWPAGNKRYDMWYRMNSGENGWIPAVNNSSDNDNGCMEFDAASDNDMSYFCLGKVNMSTASQPKLIFDYYAVPGSGMSIIPEINLAFTGEYNTLPAISFDKIEGQTGWREAVVDLTQYKTLPYICVRFLGIGTTAHPLRIDNVRIMNSDKTPNIGEDSVIVINDDDSDVMYYDITGRPVTDPVHGSILIRRTTDGKADKIIY